MSQIKQLIKYKQKNLFANKISVLFQRDLELSPRWTWKKLFALSKLRVDDCFERVLTIVIEELTTLMINCYYVLVNLRNLYLIADKRANKTTEQRHAIVQSKLTRLQDAAHKKRHKTDKNWVKNISSRPLDENETQVLSYGLKHSVTTKRIPTDDIVMITCIETAKNWTTRT